MPGNINRGQNRIESRYDMSKSYLFLLIALVSPGFGRTGQEGVLGELALRPESANFHRLTIEDGLPSNYVRDLMQDSRGFMWFGTLDGLARYDGHEFVIYQHDPRDTTTLSNNWIFSL
ncbi:MAG: hypothetical protein D6732_21510, partial [Methanobacteriota archaeon]